ncbi:tripartite tricarboxylate transporter substrate binding protein (plasmid) [Polaromonas sp. P1-6]|nr:tripartite tricarboxylate transporter substrate binding protein [Polaromonas sp. P1-6]
MRSTLFDKRFFQPTYNKGTLMKLGKLLAAGLAVLATAIGSAAHAEYPEKPIRLIIPYQAGGGTDILARVITENLRSRINQPIIIDTKPGGNTVIGAKALLAAPPDGYTLMLTTNQTFTTVPFIMKNAGYTPLESFTFINYVAYTPVVLVVHPSVKAQNLSEFIAQAKAEPNKLSYGSYGVQLSAELFQKMVGIRLNTIQYKGVEAVHALMGGHVDAMFDGVFTALPNIRAGKARALAMLQESRTQFAPEIPSAHELGVKVPSLQIWYGLVGPAGMDPKVVAKLEQEFRIAMQSAEVKEKLAKLSVESVGEGRVVLQKMVKDEYARYADIVKDLGVQPQ